MKSYKYPTYFLIILLLLFHSSIGYAQNVDESALALKKRGEAHRKAYGVKTLDEQVEVGMWFSNYDSVRTGTASFLAILMPSFNFRVSVDYGLNRYTDLFVN